MPTYDDLNDDLSDLLGGTAQVTPRAMPQDAQLARIREEVPAFVENCPRCVGRGVVGSWGTCFACKGAGKKAFKTSAAQRQRARASAVSRKEREASGNVDNFGMRYPEMLAWMNAKAQNFGFAAAMLEAVKKYGDLTENQRLSVLRCLARDAERDEARKAQAAAPRPTFLGIQKAFDDVVATGKSRVQLRVGDIHLSLAKAGSANPGAIYVKDAGVYSGKIVGGTFHAGRDAKADLAPRLALIDSDPKAAAIAHGKETGVCSCCGAELTDPASIAAGIGPICAAGW